MPANLTDNYVANTYKGVLHVNGEELPAEEKVQVYDGAGNATALKLGVVGADCISLSANGFTANDFKYPETPGNQYSVVCQTSNNTTGVNNLELVGVQQILCNANAGATYSRRENNTVPVPSTKCGIITNVNDVAISEITEADGGIDVEDSTGEFIITRVRAKGGLLTALSINEITRPAQPNLLINAQGMLNQRRMAPNASLTVDWNPRNYFIDRWKLLSGDRLNWTFNQNRNIATIFAPIGGVSQTIEKADIVPGTHILSWIGTATGEVFEGGVSKGVGTGGAGEIKSITVNLGGGGDVSVKFSNGSFTLPKFERSRIRTDFVYEDINTVFSKCQRYFCKTYNYMDRPGTRIGVGTALAGRVTSHSDEAFVGFLHNQGWDFPVRMRYRTDEGGVPGPMPRAWVFSPRTGREGFVDALEGGGRQFDHPCTPATSEVRITGLSTSKPLPVFKMRIYACHYVADAEM